MTEKLPKFCLITILYMYDKVKTEMVEKRDTDNGRSIEGRNNIL